MKKYMMTICFVLFAISSAILITLLCKPLFTLQLNYLDTQQLIGLSKKTVDDNYTQLWLYLINPFNTTLYLPDIPMSAQGMFHFIEVKQLFNLNTAIFIMSTIGVIYQVKHIKKYQLYTLVKMTAHRLMLIPPCIVFILTISFNYWFIIFHKIFFNNDAWLFNPKTDPIILVLPESFFMQSFVLVFILIEIWFMLAFIWSKKQESQLIMKG